MITVGCTSYQYHESQLRELQALVKANKSAVKALSVWLELHPCSARELIDLWGPFAEKYANGVTVDEQMTDARLLYERSLNKTEAGLKRENDYARRK